ncbi:MAG TPA: GNAT family N-acetyltransferase [Clostridia bacterium]|nr:GNAT family N-acetyltransferase [Clostridia bacterium]
MTIDKLNTRDDYETFLIEENVIEFCFLLSRGSTHGGFHLDRYRMQVETDSAFWTNFVMERSVESSFIADCIRDVKKRMIDGKSPRSWVFGPTKNHEEWDKPLNDNGFYLKERWIAMAADISQHATCTKAGPQGFSIEEFDDPQKLDVWLEIASEALCDGNALKKPMFERLLKKPHVRFYLGFYQGEPAATCLLFLTPEAAGINVVSTRAAFRKKGIASAMVQAAMKQSASEGHATAVLQASEMAVGAYEQLGFKDYGEFKLYALKA